MEGRVPAFAYLCLPAHQTRTRALEVRREVSTYAIMHGLNITQWFIDDRSSAGVALRAMLTELRKGRANLVVVPDEGHVTRPPVAANVPWTEAVHRVDVVYDPERRADASAVRDEYGLRRRVG